jgi:hypothetical protein
MRTYTDDSSIGILETLQLMKSALVASLWRRMTKDRTVLTIEVPRVDVLLTTIKKSTSACGMPPELEASSFADILSDVRFCLSLVNLKGGVSGIILL